MRCYLITCDPQRAKRQKALTDHISKLSDEWEHPHAGLWLVRTEMTAAELRSAILPRLGFNDRIYIREAGQDCAEFNTLASNGSKLVELEGGRRRSRILEGIFSRDGQGSRLLKAAISKSLR